ncbi:hypothetical protein RCL1_006864 [Eukaryota sp. TZLM3-RCL]
MIILFTVFADILIFCWLSFVTPKVIPKAAPNLEQGRRQRKLRQELKRKSLHFVGYLFPTIYYILLATRFGGKSHAVLIIAIANIIIVTSEMLRLRHPEKATMKTTVYLRESERYQVSTIVYTLLGNLFCVLFASPAASIIGLTNAVLGDLVASIVGISVGRRRIMGRKKTIGTNMSHLLIIEGSIGCMVACFALNMHFLTVFLQQTTKHSILVSLVTSTVTTLVEAFAKEGFVGDNFLVPLVTALFGDLAFRIVIGKRPINILYYRIG